MNFLGAQNNRSSQLPPPPPPPFLSVCLNNGLLLSFPFSFSVGCNQSRWLLGRTQSNRVVVAQCKRKKVFSLAYVLTESFTTYTFGLCSSRVSRDLTGLCICLDAIKYVQHQQQQQQLQRPAAKPIVTLFFRLAASIATWLLPLSFYFSFCCQLCSFCSTCAQRCLQLQILPYIVLIRIRTYTVLVQRGSGVIFPVASYADG